MKKDYDLMLRAAWAHFIEGRTQDSVATALGLTRAKTNRLIAECREMGLVRIGIDTDARIAVGEERQLRERFDLLDIWVVPKAENDEAAVRTVGASAGAYLSDKLKQGETLGLGWGRTLSASISGLQPRKSQGNRVVTLLGGMVRGNGMSSFDIATRYSRTLAAECVYLIAPRLAENAEIAHLLLERPYIREALEIAAESDVALIGVDDLGTESTLCRTGQIGSRVCAALKDSGAVCMFQNAALDSDGNVINDATALRSMGITHGAFSKIPRRVVAACGTRKAQSIRALLKGGHCNVLITDEPTASAVLELGP